LLERTTTACSLIMLAASIDAPELQRKHGFQVTHKHQCDKQPHQNGEPVWAIELEGDQLGELGRDVCHRIFCSAQAGSRAEQGADFAESFVRRLMHNGDELVTC
jgi:hypothetical protein